MLRHTLVLVAALTMPLGAVRTVPAADIVGSAIVGDKPVEDAVVWIDAPDAPRPAVRPDAVLNQQDVRFMPHVLAVQAGTRVKFPNQDRVFHNVFSFHDGRKFDLGLYPVGVVKEVPFDQPGLSRVFCNIHPQMAAYVMVLDTPYFAVSDRQGRFTIRDVPATMSRYHAWRAGGAILNGDADLTTGAPLVVTWP